MKRLLTVVLTVALAVGPAANFAPAAAQDRPATNPAAQALNRLSRAQQQALRELAKQVTELEVNDTGIPNWVMGDLGPAEGDARAAAVNALKRLGPVFRSSGDDEFEAQPGATVDELGQTHVRVEQRFNGLRVVGGRMIVHLQKGRVVGVNGNFVADLKLNTTPGLNAAAAISLATRGLDSRAVSTDKPELIVYAAKGRTPRLAWSAVVEFETQEGVPQKDEIIADAATGDLLARHPLIQTAKFRKVYSSNDTYTVPGTLKWQETSSWLVWLLLDAEGKGAATGTGHTYDFYKNVFGRDSYDNAGATLVSSVHYGPNVNNAYWDQSLHQMKYGDGDGVRFKPLSLGLDVTGHELTHAVTGATAGLVYAKESGALNEAMSDIFGECVEQYVTGSTDWKIGEDVFTPATPGDALRYMYNPTIDGYSADYYPERLYPGACIPSGGNDNCGVHGNSGIANLAFYLRAIAS